MTITLINFFFCNISTVFIYDNVFGSMNDIYIYIYVNWYILVGRDDQILFNGTLFYLANLTFEGARHMPLWRIDGVIIAIMLHASAVEFLYYWLHRALHHHYLYSRYHSHHHSSVVTEPITCMLSLSLSLSLDQHTKN